MPGPARRKRAHEEILRTIFLRLAYYKSPNDIRSTDVFYDAKSMDRLPILYEGWAVPQPSHYARPKNGWDLLFSDITPEHIEFLTPDYTVHQGWVPLVHIEGIKGNNAPYGGSPASKRSKYLNHPLIQRATCTYRVKTNVWSKPKTIQVFRLKPNWGDDLILKKELLSHFHKDPVFVLSDYSRDNYDINMWGAKITLRNLQRQLDGMEEAIDYFPELAAQHPELSNLCTQWQEELNNRINELNERLQTIIINKQERDKRNNHSKTLKRKK